MFIKCILFLRNDPLDAQSRSLAELVRMKLKVPAILSGKAQCLLHGSISNCLAGTHTNTVARRMRNEAAAQNNLPDRLRDTKTHRQKGKTVIVWGVRGTVRTIFISSFIKKKHNTLTQTQMVISTTQHEAAAWFKKPLLDVGLCAGSYNCRGSVRSGAVFVSALISKPCLVLFNNIKLQIFCPAFHLTVHWESF